MDRGGWEVEDGELKSNGRAQGQGNESPDHTSDLAWLSHLPPSVTSGTNGWVRQWTRIVDAKQGWQLTWQLPMGMMEEDMSRGWGHPEVDFLTLRVCQRATDLSMKWNMALNDSSSFAQTWTRSMVDISCDYILYLNIAFFYYITLL